MRIRGKRTQIVAAVTALVYALDQWLGWGIPNEVYMAAGAVVVCFLREGIRADNGAVSGS